MSGDRTTSSKGAPECGESAVDDLDRERVAYIQRVRILAAIAEVCAERASGDVPIAHVVERAGVSRRTFYELFRDREDCFLAAFDDVIATVSQLVFDRYDPSATWASRLRAALIVFLEFLDTEPLKGRLLIVGSAGAGPRALERRGQVLAQMVNVVDEGRGASSRSSRPPSLTAEGVVGGVLSILHARLLDKSDVPLVELTGSLMAMIVLPYLGSAAANRELERPVPTRNGASGNASDNPLRDLGMRFTYRTVRVLMALAAAPGSSNREIGVAAGISDQGQISKLLGRVERLGLAWNTDLSPGKGAPNAWALTTKGVEVQRAMCLSIDIAAGESGARPPVRAPGSVLRLHGEAGPRFS